MADYGVLPTGFSRKPLPTILQEIEAKMITQFGPDIIQTSQSPLGQINGMLSDLASQLWEMFEATYQSYDPDQAEGARLDMLGRVRLIQRGVGESDESYRKAITNVGQGRVDVQDLQRAIFGLTGVTYAQVFVNDTDSDDDNGVPPGSVSLAVIGGDDDDIAAAYRRYIVPGVQTYGNVRINSNIEGYCRTFNLVRPAAVPITLTLTVHLERDRAGCAPPSTSAIRAGLLEDWAVMLNGENVSWATVRKMVEGRFPNVEVVSIVGERDDIVFAPNSTVPINFFEIATLAAADIYITVVE
mgnify:CR=1 FL=1